MPDAPTPGQRGFDQLAQVLQGDAGAPRGRKAKGTPAPAAAPVPAETPAAELVAQAEQLVRTGHVDAALAACDAVWSRLVQADDQALMGVCQYVRTVAHQYSGRLRESMEAGYRAIELFQAAGLQARQVRALTMQSLTLARTGEAPEALKLLNDAMQVLQALPDPQPIDEAVFWNNAGAVHEILGQLAQAKAALERVLALEPEHGDRNLAAVSRANLYQLRVQILRAEAPHDEAAAMQALQEVVAHAEACAQAQRFHLAAGMAEFIAGMCLELNQVDAARQHIRLGLQWVQAMQGSPLRAALELHMAHAERLAGQMRTAAAHIANALELAAQGNEKDLIARCHLENSRLHEAQSHWRAALDCHKRYTEVREAWLKAQADSRSQAMSVRLEIERQRVEAELLRLRNAELERYVDRMASEAGELKRQALEDPLTGLANRRQFERQVAAMMAVQAGAPLVVLIADIDHFKHVNDNWSHAIGDEVLRELGALLREHSRPHDVVARFGGEEFVIAFGGGLTLDKAMKVAERLRLTVAAHKWHQVAAGLQVTLSLGLSAWRPGEQIATTLQRADAALYECKRGGRNQVRAAAA